MFYVLCFADTYYISHYPTYQERHFLHPFSIYGYDDDSFLTYDYFDFRNPQNLPVPFKQVRDSFEKAILYDVDAFDGIVLIRESGLYENSYYYFSKRSGYDIEKDGYQLDQTLLKLKLQDFLKPNQFAQKGRPNSYDIKFGYKTGFETFHMLSDSLKDAVFEGYNFNKCFHLVYCHAKLMRIRAEYICGENHALALTGNRLERKAQALRNNIIKMSMIKGSSDIENVISKFDLFTSEYREFISALIGAIRKT